jgi:hypothetical protein
LNQFLNKTYIAIVFRLTHKSCVKSERVFSYFGKVYLISTKTKSSLKDDILDIWCILLSYFLSKILNQKGIEKSKNYNLENKITIVKLLKFMTKAKATKKVIRMKNKKYIF